MLSKAISLDAAVNALADDTSRLLFTWTIAHLDYNGVIQGDPALLRTIVVPRREDVTAARVEAILADWEEHGLVVRYQARGEHWIWFPAFEKNQVGLRKERERASGYPLPPPKVVADRWRGSGNREADATRRRLLSEAAERAEIDPERGEGSLQQAFADRIKERSGRALA